MRLIDADAAILDARANYGGVHDAVLMERFLNSQPTIAPPPNDPLTLEELREMGYEWVWIKPLIPLYNMVEGYYIKKSYASTLDRFCCGFPDVVPWSKVRYLFYSEYGEKWIAYRNKPED